MIIHSFIISSAVHIYEFSYIHYHHKISFNVQFHKKSIPTPWKIMGKSQGEGVLGVKILEAKYEAKLEFPGEGGCKTKSLAWGGGGGGGDYA